MDKSGTFRNLVHDKGWFKLNKIIVFTVANLSYLYLSSTWYTDVKIKCTMLQNQAIWYYAMVRFRTIDLKTNRIRSHNLRKIA